MADFAVGCGGVIDINDRNWDTPNFEGEPEAAGEEDHIVLVPLQFLNQQMQVQFHCGHLELLTCLQLTLVTMKCWHTHCLMCRTWTKATAGL